MKTPLERLKVARAELRIAQRTYNQTKRRLERLLALVAKLEQRLGVAP